MGRAMLANASNLTNRRHRLFKASQFHSLHRVEGRQLSPTRVYAQSALKGSVDGSVWTSEQTTAQCAS